MSFIQVENADHGDLGGAWEILFDGVKVYDKELNWLINKSISQYK